MLALISLLAMYIFFFLANLKQIVNNNNDLPGISQQRSLKEVEELTPPDGVKRKLDGVIDCSVLNPA